MLLGRVKGWFCVSKNWYFDASSAALLGVSSSFEAPSIVSFATRLNEPTNTHFVRRGMFTSSTSVTLRRVWNRPSSMHSEDRSSRQIHSIPLTLHYQHNLLLFLSLEHISSQVQRSQSRQIYPSFSPLKRTFKHHQFTMNETPAVDVHFTNRLAVLQLKRFP